MVEYLKRWIRKRPKYRKLYEIIRYKIKEEEWFTNDDIFEEVKKIGYDRWIYGTKNNMSEMYRMLKALAKCGIIKKQKMYKKVHYLKVKGGNKKMDIIFGKEIAKYI